MEVVKEADAPEPPPAVTPHESERAEEALAVTPHESERAADALAASPHESDSAADALPILEAPAPPPPEGTPPDPALPAATKDAADEALPFQRPALRTVLAARLWAGLLGGGVWFWVAGMIGSLTFMRVISRLGDELHMFLAFLPALAVVMARGFREPVRSYRDLLGRLLGALFFGLLWMAIAGLVVVLVATSLRLRDQGVFVVMTLVAAPMIGLALARIHGIGAAKPRRIKIAAASAAVLFVSCWPALPTVRCYLGFAEGCRAAGDSRWVDGDYRAAGELGARGCRGEDSLSCRLAGQAYQSEGPARDLRLAEGFFREGCALGDPTSCDRVHGIELERRCDRFSATACTELARAHMSGEGAEQDSALAKRLYRKACLLGSEDACWTVERNP